MTAASTLSIRITEIFCIASQRTKLAISSNTFASYLIRKLRHAHSTVFFSIWDIATQKRKFESKESFAEGVAMDQQQEKLILADGSGVLYFGKPFDFDNFVLEEAHHGKIWSLSLSPAGFLASG